LQFVKYIFLKITIKRIENFLCLCYNLDMKYKMLVCDFDGTIKDYTAPTADPRIMAAVARYREAGGKFVICTGREYYSIGKQLERIGYEGEILLLQGSACYNGEELIFSETMEEDITLEILKMGKERGYIPQLYGTKDYYVEAPNPSTTGYEEYTETEAIYVGSLYDYAKNNNFRANKVLTHCPVDKAKDYMQELQTKFGSKVEVAMSTPTFVEVSSGKAGKGKAIARLADICGIPLSEVVACGDATNDISMLQTAGFAVAVDGGMDEVKNFADYICPPPSQGGVAEVIDKIITDTLLPNKSAPKK